MPRPVDPRAKTHNPEYVAERNRQVRHRHHAQVSIRIPEDTLAAWHATAARREQSLKDWIVETLNRASATTDEP